MCSDALPLAIFAMNTTINVSTGFNLFYMLYGTQVALPIDYALPAPPTSVATSHVATMK